MGQALLRTPRLTIQPLTAGDVPALHALWTTAGVRRFLWDDEIVPLERTETIVATSAALIQAEGYGLWGGRTHDGGAFVGIAGFWHFREPPELEFLFAIAEERWRQGFAIELGRAIIDHGFTTLGMPEIRASTDAPNVASIRALMKLGFQQTKRAMVGERDTIFFRLPTART
jgi:RimJ/RimL family protein N-acetyltransferase